MMKISTIAYIITALAVAGLLDSGYLYFTHLQGGDLSCGFLEGCNVVAASPYSVLFGIPLSLWGLIFYAGVLVLGVGLLTDRLQYVKKLFYIAAVIGVLFSLYFFYIQAFLIGAWCIYCIISAFLTVALAVVAFYMWRKKEV
jgi:uncharacterized membrane protein